MKIEVAVKVKPCSDSHNSHTPYIEFICNGNLVNIVLENGRKLSFTNTQFKQIAKIMNSTIAEEN